MLCIKKYRDVVCCVKKYRDVVCMNSLRERLSALQQKLYPDLSSSNQRAEFLPVEWRTSLRLDGGENTPCFTCCHTLM